MEELKFATEDEAIQHLANLTGSRIKIAEKTGWDRFEQYIDIWSWDVPIETGEGDLTDAEEKQIYDDDFYGKPITKETIQMLKDGKSHKGSDFELEIRSSDGISTQTFDSKEDLIARAKEYPGFKKGEDHWSTEDGQNISVVGVKYDDIFDQ